MRYRSRAGAEAARVRWNNAVVEERRRLGLPTVNLDWATAMYLFHEGVRPEDAARRVKAS